MKSWWTQASSNQRVGLAAVAVFVVLYLTDNLWSAIATVLSQMLGQ